MQLSEAFRFPSAWNYLYREGVVHNYKKNLQYLSTTTVKKEEDNKKKERREERSGVKFKQNGNSSTAI